jgi:MHS family alpha-ketoglutarate permease-like MFS transporter
MGDEVMSGEERQSPEVPPTVGLAFGDSAVCWSFGTGRTMTATTQSKGTVSRLRAVAGGCAGNLVEWYDWNVYAYFALYFAQAFFPEGDETSRLLKTAVVLGVGFLMRPLGAWLMGVYADRKGRKAALTLSVGLMCFGSLAIAVTPTYAQAGWLGPAILTAARLLQGLSLGGEYGASATYLSEVTGRRWRGFWSSFHYVTLILGQLLALGTLIGLQVMLTPEDLAAWGWRIPFLIGALLAVTVWWLRRSLDETEHFTREGEADPGGSRTMLLFLRHPKETLMVIGLTAGGSLSFYTYTVYMQKFLVNSVGYAKDVASQIMALALLVFMALQPAFGALSDRIGRRPLLIAFGVLGTLTPIPIMSTLAQTHDPVVTFLLVMTALTVISCYSSISSLFKAELFPTQVRALGVALPYALANSIFGGGAEPTALWLKTIGRETWFYGLVSITVGLGLTIALSMRDTRKHSRIDADVIQEP